MQETRERRLQLEEEMHTALEKNQFEVFYQPRVELETSRICGFEALVRWNHPVSGLISPLEFIPIAENNGFICELGEWILQQACTQTQQWISHFHLAPDFEISVNLSVRQCRQPDLTKQILTALRLSGLDAKHLKLEITESLFLGDFKVAKGVLQKLKALGLGLKLDDFGTGYSCFQYLCDLPFDSLKIDRAFVRRLGDGSAQATEVIRSVVNIGHSLNMEVIAEGIENEEQAEQLSAIGCQFGQGFLYSKPVNASTAEEILRQQTLLPEEKPADVRAA
jgi:EAL domain-containing protein (putative c-di-GMP-specific phosphodiesterase class I)